MMIVSPFWGALADRYGRKLMLERSMFGGSVILLMMAFVTSAEQLVALRLIQGTVTGTLAAANAMVAAVAPRRQLGYAMGLMQVAMGSGVAMGPLIGGVIADAFGYHAVFYVTAALLLISGILVWLGIEEHFTPAEKDASKGLNGLFGEWRHVFSTPGVPTTYSLRFLSQIGRMMLIPILPLFIPLLLADTSRLNTFTGLVIGVTSATTTLSAVFLGRLGDKTGHRRIIIVCASAATLLYLAQTQVTEGWQLLVLQALVGVCLGGVIPSISALLASFTDTGEAGAVYGLDNSIVAAGRTVAPLISTAVAAVLGLRSTFALAAVLFLVTATMAAWQLPRVQKVEETQPAT
jgi:DHA1 family multidrug resistance protein-like MFS transporter